MLECFCLPKPYPGFNSMHTYIFSCIFIKTELPTIKHILSSTHNTWPGSNDCKDTSEIATVHICPKKKTNVRVFSWEFRGIFEK